MFEMLASTTLPNVTLCNPAEVHREAGVVDGDIPAIALAVVAVISQGHLAIRRIGGARPGAAA